MTTPTLDKSKPHSTVWGGLFHGRLFQGGQLFDHDGNHLGDGSDGNQTETNAFVPAAATAPTEDATQAIATAQAAAAEHGNFLLKAVKLVEQATDKVIAELADVPDHMLDFVHQVESAGKGRAPVLAAVLQEKGSRAMQAEKDAQANGLTAAQAGLAPAAPSAAAPAGANDQLSAQLSS